MTYESIKTSEAGGIARITLNKEPLNVMDIPMMREIAQAVREVKGKPIKALVIEAEGRAFSAGVDVSDHTPDKVGEMIEVFHSIFTEINSVDAPVIASVHGAALGGGCELALGCDIVLASEKAKFGQPEVAVGVFPPLAAALYPRLANPRKVLELLLTGATVRAPEALQLGLINQVFPVEGFAAAVDGYLTDNLANKSAVVLAYTKRAVVAGMQGSLPDALGRIEALYLDELMKTADAKEGLTAFLEKRSPKWQDR